MLKNIFAARTLELDCPQDYALNFIWDIKNVEYTEVKADDVQVTKETEHTGIYTVRGHFAGIPWSRKFTYVLYDKGFHSREAELPVSPYNIEGGFMVEELGPNRVRIIHYEQYTLPLYFVPLKPLIVAYLKWSQWKEMSDMKELIYQRLAQTRQLASQAA